MVFPWILFLIPAACMGYSGSLQCWQCIADTCDQDPQHIDRATTRVCRQGESCQKVFYQVKAAKEDIVYESTVRTCSVGHCEPRNDFVNCSKDALENPGCMQRFCCNDRDMCNMAVGKYSNSWFLVAFSLSLWILLMLEER